LPIWAKSRPARSWRKYRRSLMCPRDRCGSGPSERTAREADHDRMRAGTRARRPRAPAQLLHARHEQTDKLAAEAGLGLELLDLVLATAALAFVRRLLDQLAKGLESVL